MKYLLDTHVIIWLAKKDNEKLSSKSMEIIRSQDSQLFISIISFWEIALKMNNGKLVLGISLDTLFDNIEKSGITITSIEKEYILRLSTLPPVHKDPFDRLLITTALIEDMTLLTADENNQKYDVPWIW